MKQIFYVVAAIIALFFAIRLMAKVKDVPEKEPDSENEDEDSTPLKSGNEKFE